MRINQFDYLFRAAIVCLASVSFPTQVFPQGIPEPSRLLYGQIYNPPGGPFARVTAGTLTWTFQPAGGGTSVTVTVQCTNLYAPYAFIVQVPCETPMPGLTSSSNVLELTSPPQAYVRTNVMLNGQPIFLKHPSQSSLSLTSTNRGQMEQVDLTLLQSDQDSNGNGLPDGWQLQYFGHLGIDPNDDPDHDGMSNLAEYIAGTAPNDPSSNFRLLNARKDSPDGIVISWSSVVNRTYSVLRSTNLFTGFQVIATGVISTPPATQYQDNPPAQGTMYFYKVSIP
jgi:hypothetical protein